ncbi:MAG TPA: hypothetical protein VL522_23365 [Bordetella sp.]|nr:hypothetical protein [Bordetella sp.]
MSDTGIRIVEMPNLGAINDSSYVVGERAGSGLFAATALRTYCSEVSACMVPVCAAPTIGAAIKQLGAIGTVTASDPAVLFNVSETLNTGTDFYDALVVFHHRLAGAVGHRQAFTAQLFVNGATPPEMNCGGCFFAFLESGSGSVFGGNTYAKATAGAAITASICSFEANTDTIVAVARKAGINVVDVSTSIGDGIDLSAAIYIARQPGGQGYRDGILFGDDHISGMNGVRQAYIRAAAGAGEVSVGIDFRTAIFGGAAIALPVGTQSAINWGSGNGGGLVNDSPINGPTIHFGNNGLTVVGITGSTALSLGTGTIPTVLVYVTGVGLREITAGAPNSGSPGTRMVLVPN